MKALAAGKHVLLEKPSTNTAEETRKVFAFAQEKRLVSLGSLSLPVGPVTHDLLTFSEPMVGRFYPAIRRLREIVDSGGLGSLTKIEVNLAVPSGFIKDNWYMSWVVVA